MKTIFISLLLIVCIGLSSCLATKISVGNYDKIEGKESVFSKQKQVYLFWALLPLGKKNINTPDSGQCEITTRINLIDVVIFTFTAGLIVTYTIKVKAKENNFIH